jgi:GNAT superfamily N-acetyltransferase
MNNFFTKARKYGFFKHLKYLSNYTRASAHLQMDLNYIPPVPKSEFKFSIREINPQNDNDIKDWISIVKDGDNMDLTLEKAKKHIINHEYINISNTFLLALENIPIATFGIGTFKENVKIGGSNRLVVKKAYQGMGIGKYMLLYGLDEMRNNGIRYVEHLISITRKESIYLHFNIGFIPQFNSRSYAYRNQRRFWFINLLAKYKLWNHYRIYKQNLSRKFKK